MMMEDNKKKTTIDIKIVLATLWANRWLFLKVWVITFVLACVWILPQPRYYTTQVSIAPESTNKDISGDIASLASNFGFNIGNASSDAIYPQLYPDVFKSTKFLVGLLDIKITTNDGKLSTDYYTYMKDYQKTNILAWPFIKVSDWIKKAFEEQDTVVSGHNGKRFSPFRLSRNDTRILEKIGKNIYCKYSRTTEVVTIEVTDQDPLVSALLADSIKEHLQEYITHYRTNKARIDYAYYKELTAEAKQNYDRMLQRYGAFADGNTRMALESVRLKAEQMENELEMKLTTYQTFKRQSEHALAKIQEQTPAFTTLINATVPVKPAGPKRMIFVAVMLFLSTIGVFIHLYRKELREWF